MILVCPECSTKYLTQDDKVGPNGRTVRCARCHTTWFVSAAEAAPSPSVDEIALEEDLKSAPELETYEKKAPPADDAAPSMSLEAPPVGAHITLRDMADAKKLKMRRKVIRLIWGGLLLLILLAGLLAYVFRQEIVNSYPKAATLYKAVGITVKTAGLEIENPIAKTAIIDGQTVLIVNSAIRNVSAQGRKVPVIKFSLHNRNGESLVQWYVEPEKPHLRSSERMEFTSQFPNPPIDAVDLRYDFVKDGEL